MEHCKNCIVFRIAGIMPTSGTLSLDLLGEMFHLHPDGRIEVIVDKDAARGLIRGVELLYHEDRPPGRSYILGGGKINGCQGRVERFLTDLFEAVGLPLPDRDYFSPSLTEQYTDWYDTDEAEKLFHFQHYHIDYFFDKLNNRYGKYSFFIKLFRNLIMKKIVSYSPYRADLHSR